MQHVILAHGEGERGLQRRVAAWEKFHGRKLPPSIRFVIQPFNMLHSAHVAALIEAVVGVCDGKSLVIVDTMNRATPGADENSPIDMSKAIEAAKALLDATGGMVVLVHHMGKDVSRGARGHSSLYAALDAAISVANEGRYRIWSTDPSRGGKTKDGEATSGQFSLEQVVVATDIEGKAVTSACVVPIGAPVVVESRPTTPRMRAALDALSRAAEGVTGQSVHVEKWRKEFYRTCTVETYEGKRKAFQRARNELTERGLVFVDNDMYTTEASEFEDLTEVENSSGHGDTSGTQRDIVPAARPLSPGQGGHTPKGVSHCPERRLNA